MSTNNFTAKPGDIFKRKWLVTLILSVLVAVGLVVWYEKTHPYVCCYGPCVTVEEANGE